MNGRGIARHWDGRSRSAPASVRSVGARNLSERTALCSSGPTMVISRESSVAMSLWKSKDPRAMLLLLDIGNTNTHVGIANERAVLRQMNIPTDGWFNGSAEAPLRRFLHTHHVKAAALCSVVPRATRQAVSKIKKLWQIDCLILGPQTVRGV